jgi:hypothetical protein
MAITAVFQTVSWLVGAAILAAAHPAAAPDPAQAVTPVTSPAATPMPPDTGLVGRDQVEAAGLTLYWQRGVDLNRGERLARISRIEENLYLITDQDRVLTLDAGTGVFRWMAALAEPGIRLLGPSHGPDLVYFASVLGIQAFDRVNGERQLRYKGAFGPSSPVASDGRDLVFGTSDGRVVNLNLRDMQVNWQFATDGLVTAKPLLLGSNLFVVSAGGRVYAATMKDKTEIWTARTTGPVQAAPAVYGSHLYVPSLDQSLWCFDLVTGRTVWRTRMPTPLFDEPKATAGHLYLPVTEHGLYAFDPDNGGIDWHREDAAGFLAEAGRLVWLISARASLLGCDNATGQIRHELPTSADLWFSNEDDDAIWLARYDGQVVCLRPAGAGFLRYRTARQAASRTTPPSTNPASQPAESGFVPTPPPKPPVDYLRASEAIPPVAGHVPPPQPAGNP